MSDPEPQRLCDDDAGARDALAGMLRDTGAHAFDIDDELDLFKARCERWSRHVLTGAEPPGGGKDSHGDGTRQWPQLALFYRSRRQAEQSFVNSRLDKFKTIIWDIVHGLRAMTATGSDTEKQIADSIGRLERALESDSLETVRAALGPAVHSIRDALTRQREQFSAELARMTTRLEDMRGDLATAREKMQLDALTQVYNRGAFDEALQRYVDLASLSHQPLNLMMIDLDHFKSINDRFGHPVGDLVLQQSAECLVRCFLRKNDFVARYGGEEFAIILGDTPPHVVPRLADNALKKLREVGIEHAGETVRVTASIGYAALAPDDNAASLVARADRALYEAKSAGRDRSVAAPDSSATRAVAGRATSS